MSVLIKGMDMPEKCCKCKIEDDWYYCSFANGDNGDTAELRYDERLINCPLVEIPEKHGRLIDADELKQAIMKWLPPDPCGIEEREYPFEIDICVSLLQEIEEQPTIIEAE